MCQLDFARGYKKHAEAYQEACIYLINSHSLGMLHDTNSIRSFAGFRQAFWQPHNHVCTKQVAFVLGKQDFLFIQDSFDLRQAADAVIAKPPILSPVRALRASASHAMRRNYIKLTLTTVCIASMH